MCGIAGIVNVDPSLPPPEWDALDRMAAVLHHRGPDGAGAYRDDMAGLSHARLAIIDVEGGGQPLANEDETLWIVFNGEIFNYIELRRELETAGHRFRTRSDTEVIVHAFEEWREGAFSRFNGQWAAALWDAPRRSLVLARDPFGVRPLYTAEHRGRLLFGSTVAALFAAEPTLPRQFDPIGLDQTFTFWTTVAPRTVFEGVEELRPGAVRTFAMGRPADTSVADVWHPGEGNSRLDGSIEAAATTVADTLSDATRLRLLRSDVAVGCYLSGGLDSSIIAALARRHQRSRLSTFSLRFEESSYDEGRYQHAMRGVLGSDHQEVVVSNADIARVFPTVVVHAERPLLRTAPAPMFLLSERVRRSGIKVVLTGEGADELFGGYDLFREAKVRRYWARDPSSARRASLLERLYPYLAHGPAANAAIARRFFGQRLDEWNRPGFGHQLRWSGASALKRLFDPMLLERLSGVDVVGDLLAALPPGFDRWPFLDQDQYLEMRTLLAGYLLASQGDRMLMAHSVEGRFPFLDRRVAKLAAALPPTTRLKVLDEKHVLKRAAAGLVPDEIRRRKKQPYRAPDAAALTRPEARAWIEEIAGEQHLREAGVFHAAAARRLIEKCLAAPPSTSFSNADNMAFTGLLSTQVVYDQFVRRSPHAVPPLRRSVHIDRSGVAVTTGA